MNFNFIFRIFYVAISLFNQPSSIRCFSINNSELFFFISIISKASARISFSSLKTFWYNLSNTAFLTISISTISLSFFKSTETVCKSVILRVFKLFNLVGTVFSLSLPYISNWFWTNSINFFANDDFLTPVAFLHHILLHS